MKLTEGKVKVYTGQGYNLETFDGLIDFSKRTYRFDDLNDPKVTVAQQRLYKMLGEDQLVWSTQLEWQARAISAYEFVHTLLLDESSIFAVLSGWLWTHCWAGDGCTSVPSNVDWRHSRDGEELRTAWLKENLPKDPWEHVVLGSTIGAIEDEEDQILIRWPFDRKLIVSVQRRRGSIPAQFAS